MSTFPLFLEIFSMMHYSTYINKSGGYELRIMSNEVALF